MHSNKQLQLRQQRTPITHKQDKHNRSAIDFHISHAAVWSLSSDEQQLTLRRPDTLLLQLRLYSRQITEKTEERGKGQEHSSRVYVECSSIDFDFFEMMIMM